MNGNVAEVVVTELVPNADFRREVQSAWLAFRSKGWEIARLAARVDTEGWWATWRFNSLTEWAKADLKVDRSYLSRLVDAGKYYDSCEPEQQKKLATTPVWVAAEALSSHFGKKNPEAAYELAISGKSQKQIREAIREGETDQHHDHEWRTFTVKYPLAIRDLLFRSLNRARFEAGLTDPTPAQLFECILSRFVDEPLERESDRLAVENGEACCALWKRPELRSPVCSGWNRNQIDRHHAIARSSNGHDGPIVPLCRADHDLWQSRWRELAVHLGYADLVPTGGDNVWGSESRDGVDEAELF